MDQQVRLTPEAISAVPHRAFSFGRIAAIAANTLRELTRLRVFYVLLLFALFLIVASTLMARLGFQQEFHILKDGSLGAMNIFTSLLAILAAGRMLPQDIEDRTIYTILAKPVHRSEYLAGKLAGVLWLLAISILVMAALFFALLYVRQETVIAQTMRQMSGAPMEQISEAVRSVRVSAFNPNLLSAIAMIFVKAALLASLTVFISTFATSNLFTAVVAVMAYFIGHLEGTAREFWLQEQGGGWASALFLACVALIFPDLQQFNFADQIGASPAIPLPHLVKTAALGCFYVLVYFSLAAAVFEGKEL